MIEFHILSLIIGIAVGMFIGGWAMITISMHEWSDAYDKGSDSAKKIYWDMTKLIKEAQKIDQRADWDLINRVVEDMKNKDEKK